MLLLVLNLLAVLCAGSKLHCLFRLSLCAMQVHVYLPSGKSCSIALVPELSVRELKAEAQQQFNRRFLRLVFEGQQLDPSNTLSEVGVRDGDSIDAIVQPLKLTSTYRAFALHVAGGKALTWGSPHFGSDSSQVSEQLLRVRQIQATDEAFAAIVDDGSVVTWGHPDSGGDSQVREQLVQVQQIQSNGGAFAAILQDGSVESWGDPDYGGDCGQVREQLVRV